MKNLWNGIEAIALTNDLDPRVYSSRLLVGAAWWRQYFSVATLGDVVWVTGNNKTG
ncbi:MAG: hypothetical protein GY807_08615 [Gammaproteobacteria bacterium]|nr:hypothetical protein [Gammaproteobacteria bacterium]